jgi:hypothetical protein
MSTKRQYKKRSDYWKKFNSEQSPLMPQPSQIHGGVVPITSGEPFYTSDASTIALATRTADMNESDPTMTRLNRAGVAVTTSRFSSIRMGMMPYEYAADGVNVREAIELCQKAYANVAVFRNAIDTMAEFANAEIYLEQGNKSSRDFFYRWFNKVKIWDLKDQWFREFYRSGNIFLYRVDGDLSIEDFNQLSKTYAAENLKKDKIPVRYILLNPFDIVAKRSTTFATGAYEKILSEYDMERLRNPKDQYDQDLFDALDKDIQNKIKKGQYYARGLLIKLENDKLSYTFYKKQDYEPFAIPFGFPVLEDINAKLELKKMDQAITRTVENVILLITMGAEPDKGGINANNLHAMQQLFLNESVGRVLVSDYTTKAEFIIPDISKIIGPEKYQVLNEDIRIGLQNIMVGTEKYNTTEVKARIFMDKLDEARKAFLNDFLNREIRRISNSLGFRNIPIAKFVDIDSKDETELLRVATRLMELGVVTPQQGLDIFNTGRFPRSEDIGATQEQFVSERKKGYYNPIVGGVPMIAPPAPKLPAGAKVGGLSGNPAGNPAIKPAAGPTAKPKTTNQTPKSAGRPNGKKAPTKSAKGYSRKNIQEVVGKIEQLRSFTVELLKGKYDTKELNESQTKIVDQLCESIVTASEINEWNNNIEACVNNIENIQELQTLENVLEISSEHELATYPAAILYHSEKI